MMNTPNNEQVLNRLRELRDCPDQTPIQGQRYLDLRDTEVETVIGFNDQYVHLQAKRDGFTYTISRAEFSNWYRVLSEGVAA